jgi:hypothetical protein
MQMYPALRFFNYMILWNVLCLISDSTEIIMTRSQRSDILFYLQQTY